MPPSQFSLGIRYATDISQYDPETSYQKAKMRVDAGTATAEDVQTVLIGPGKEDAFVEFMTRMMAGTTTSVESRNMRIPLSLDDDSA